VTRIQQRSLYISGMAGVDQGDGVGKARQQIPANSGIGGQFRQLYRLGHLYDGSTEMQLRAIGLKQR
jgi:hypothetical protein